MGYLRPALFWIITQPVVVIPYRRFGTTYWSHLQGSRIPKEIQRRAQFSSTLRWMPEITNRVLLCAGPAQLTLQTMHCCGSLSTNYIKEIYQIPTKFDQIWWPTCLMMIKTCICKWSILY